MKRLKRNGKKERKKGRKEGREGRTRKEKRVKRPGFSPVFSELIHAYTVVSSWPHDSACPGTNLCLNCVEVCSIASVSQNHVTGHISCRQSEEKLKEEQQITQAACFVKKKSPRTESLVFSV